MINKISSIVLMVFICALLYLATTHQGIYHRGTGQLICIIVMGIFFSLISFVDPPFLYEPYKESPKELKILKNRGRDFIIIMATISIPLPSYYYIGVHIYMTYGMKACETFERIFIFPVIISFIVSLIYGAIKIWKILSLIKSSYDIAINQKVPNK